MSTMTRGDLAERLREMKRQAFPRCSMERLGMSIVPTDDATWADLIELENDRQQVDRYLRGFTRPVAGTEGGLIIPDQNPCPCCGGKFGFSWGIAHGHGTCSCGWPATMLHYVHDLREDPDVICAATLNGHPVCTARRGDHVPFETTYNQGTPAEVVEVELRCPEPTLPPGLTRMSAATYRPPMIMSMTRLLFAHPYTVHLT